MKDDVNNVERVLNMRKNALFYMIFVLMLIVILSACGDESSKNTTTETKDNNVEKESNNTSSEEESDDDDQEKETESQAFSHVNLLNEEPIQVDSANVDVVDFGKGPQPTDYNYFEASHGIFILE